MQWVAATPEEVVRQNFIQKMLALGFPKGLISVEKNLAPDRRIDLLCHTTVKEKIVPLLLVECKAIEINRAAEQQVFGYNAAIQAPFICLANQKEIKTLWKEMDKIASVPFLPSYAQLVEKLCLLLKL